MSWGVGVSGVGCGGKSEGGGGWGRGSGNCAHKCAPHTLFSRTLCAAH